MSSISSPYCMTRTSIGYSDTATSPAPRSSWETRARTHAHSVARLSVCYLLAQGHAATQGAGEPDDLGHEGLEGEVFLEHDPPQNGLHLRNTRTCEEEETQAAVQQVSFMKNRKKRKGCRKRSVCVTRWRTSRLVLATSKD